MLGHFSKEKKSKLPLNLELSHITASLQKAAEKQH